MRVILTILFIFIATNAYGWSNDSVISLIYDGTGLNVGKNPKEIISLHGPALSKEIKQVKNLYSSLPDTVFIYRYREFIAHFYKYNNPENGWTNLVQLSIIGKNIKISQGISIGMTELDVIKILGNPTDKTQKNDTTYYHYTPELKFDNEHFPSEHEQLRLEFTNSRLKEFTWLNWPQI